MTAARPRTLGGVTGAERLLLLCTAGVTGGRIADAVRPLAPDGRGWRAVHARIQTYPFRAVAGLMPPAFAELGASIPVPAAITDYADAAYRRHEDQNRRWLAELGRVVAALRSVGIDGVAVKGPALLCVLYRGLGERRIADLDLLVAAEQAAAAEACLRGLGYAPTAADERRRGEYLTAHHHLPPLIRTDGALRLVVELQWAVSAYRRCPAFARRLADRGTTAYVGGVEVRVPSPAYLFVHAVLDTLGHAFEKGVAPFADLRHLACADEAGRLALDWDAVLAEVAALDVAADAALVLRAADLLVGLPVPNAVRARLGVDRVADAPVAAAVERALRRPPDDLLTWRLVARALYARGPAGARGGAPQYTAPGVGAVATADGSLARRTLRQMRRAAASLPQARACVRSARAELVLADWFGAQERRRAGPGRAAGATGVG